MARSVPLGLNWASLSLSTGKVGVSLHGWGVSTSPSSGHLRYLWVLALLALGTFLSWVYKEKVLGGMLPGVIYLYRNSLLGNMTKANSMFHTNRVNYCCRLEFILLNHNFTLAKRQKVSHCAESPPLHPIRCSCWKMGSQKVPFLWKGLGDEEFVSDRCGTTVECFNWAVWVMPVPTA